MELQKPINSLQFFRLASSKNKTFPLFIPVVHVPGRKQQIQAKETKDGHSFATD